MTSDDGSAIVGFALSISLVVSAFVFLISLVQLFNAQSQLALVTAQAARAAARYGAPTSTANTYLKKNYLGQLDCLQRDRVLVGGVSFVRIQTCDRVQLSWLPVSVAIRSTAKAVEQL
jgi:hypothetical protein